MLNLIQHLYSKVLKTIDYPLFFAPKALQKKDRLNANTFFIFCKIVILLKKQANTRLTEHSSYQPIFAIFDHFINGPFCNIDLSLKIWLKKSFLMEIDYAQELSFC